MSSQSGLHPYQHLSFCSLFLYTKKMQMGYQTRGASGPSLTHMLHFARKQHIPSCILKPGDQSTETYTIPRPQHLSRGSTRPTTAIQHRSRYQLTLVPKCAYQLRHPHWIEQQKALLRPSASNGRFGNLFELTNFNL